MGVKQIVLVRKHGCSHPRANFELAAEATMRSSRSPIPGTIADLNDFVEILPASVMRNTNSKSLRSK